MERDGSSRRVSIGNPLGEKDIITGKGLQPLVFHRLLRGHSCAASGRLFEAEQPFDQVQHRMGVVVADLALELGHRALQDGLDEALREILDLSYAVFSRGDAVTLAAIASGSGRPWHGWVWLVSGVVCVLFGAFVVGSIVELWIKQLKE